VSQFPKVRPIGMRRPPPPAAPPAPEFRPHFSPEALDSMIDLVVKKTVATIRAREAALLRKNAQSE